MIVTVIVLASAALELKVDVETPLAFVVVGGVKVPPAPEALSTTVAPGIALPPASFAVTVMSEAVPAPVLQPLLQAVIVPGAAPAVESVIDGVVEAVTVTAAVWVMATLLIVAEMVLGSAVSEENVDVETPEAFVVVGGVKLLFEPGELSTTVAPWIGLPNPSFAVTVISDAVPAPVVQPLPHAVIEPREAPTVDDDADTSPTERAIVVEVSGVKKVELKLNV